MLKLEIHQNFEKYRSLEQLTSKIKVFESAKVSAQGVKVSAKVSANVFESAKDRGVRVRQGISQRSRVSEVSPEAADCSAREEAAGGDAAVLAALQSWQPCRAPTERRGWHDRALRSPGVVTRDALKAQEGSNTREYSGNLPTSSLSLVVGAAT